MVLMATPFHGRQQRKVFFVYRPNQFVGSDIKELGAFPNSKIRGLNDSDWWSSLDLALICGTGIISKEYIIPNLIINCHSRLTQMSRGVDSFKWLILNCQRIGNSVHFINVYVDKRESIHHRTTPASREADLSNLARRYYEFGMDMLCNFEHYMSRVFIIAVSAMKSTFRMPLEKEKCSKSDSRQ